jgi:RNA recognition motif-containing protein
MSAKLYVGNLAYTATNADLEQAFGEFGEVKSVRIITDRESGRSKGFGFVEMGSSEEGQKAMNGLNGKEVLGRAIKIDEAKDNRDNNRDSRPPRNNNRSQNRW